MFLTSSGMESTWSMKQDNLSPYATTRWG
ncbi:DUF4113 domain-containing protein (plasmid) [Coxiella burnetii]|nr:DUF4113 domain-containing protein [Coxiella burnetii]OYK81242.1 DUF4113 domain-containing protein [Coxiella burnetii]